MGFFKKYGQLCVIIGLSIYIFLNRSCSKPTSKDNYQKFQTKEVVGKFETQKNPKEIDSKKTYIYKPSKGKSIVTKNPIDSILIESFIKAPDIVKTEMFVDQAQIRSYKNVFDNIDATVTIDTKVRGELLEMTPSYVFKSRLDSIKVKETTFAMYAGAGIYSSPDATKTGFKVNLRFQNKKGDLFSTSYDLLNKIIYAEYDIRFINIKK